MLKSSCNYCAIFSQFLGGLEHTRGTDAQKSVDRCRIRTDDHQPLRASGRRPNQLSYRLLLIYHKLGKFITKEEPKYFGATFHQLSSLVLFNIWVVSLWTLSHMLLNPSHWPSVFARSSGTPMSETLWVVLNCFPVSSHSPFLAVMENICIASYLFTSALYKLVFWEFRISSHRVYSTRRKFCFLALWQTR